MIILKYGCDACMPPPFTLQSWKSSRIATATMRCSISSHVVISSTAAHPGEHPVPSAGQGILRSPRGGCFSSCLSSHIILRGQRDSGNTGGVSLKRSVEAWKCVRGEERPCSLALPDVILCHYNLAQAGKSVLPRVTMGRQHLASKGQPGVVSWDHLVLCVSLQGISPQRMHHRHLYIWSAHIYHGMGVQEGICTSSVTPAVLSRFVC